MTKPTWRRDVGSPLKDPRRAVRPHEPTRILGVDPGSRVTGYAILEKAGGSVTLLDRGALKVPLQREFASRVLYMADGLAAVLDASRPDEAAIEDLFHAVNPRSALQLAHVRGALVVEIVRRGIPLFAYAALEVKKAITGAGRAEKSQVRGMVERLLKISLGTEVDDVSDAVAVALCHANTQRNLR